jgi:hypothetical protein
VKCSGMHTGGSAMMTVSQNGLSVLTGLERAFTRQSQPHYHPAHLGAFSNEMLYDPELGSLTALKLSRLKPNLPRSPFPSSFSLPA